MLVAIDLDLYNPFVPSVTCKLHSLSVDIEGGIITLVFEVNALTYEYLLGWRNQGRIISVRSYHPYNEGKED